MRTSVKEKKGSYYDQERHPSQSSRFKVCGMVINYPTSMEAVLSSPRYLVYRSLSGEGCHHP